MERCRVDKAETERELTAFKAKTELDTQRSDLSGHPQFQRVSLSRLSVHPSPELRRAVPLGAAFRTVLFLRFFCFVYFVDVRCVISLSFSGMIAPPPAPFPRTRTRELDGFFSDPLALSTALCCVVAWIGVEFQTPWYQSLLCSPCSVDTLIFQDLRSLLRF